MRQQTTRLAGTWVRVTLVLVAGLVVVMTVYGLGSVQFKLGALAAVLVDLLTARSLCREWAWQARGSWWRFW